MSYHIFRDEHRDMLLTIVHTEGMSDELWSDHTSTRPCFDDCFSSTGIEKFDLLCYSWIDVGSFFEGASHKEEILDFRF